MFIKKARLSLLFLFLFFFSGVNCSSDTSLEFKGERAYQYLKDECRFGPRNPGSPGHQALRKYLLDFFSAYSNLIRSQDFVWEDTTGNLKFDLSNIIVSFYPEKKERVLLCAHWDTRPWADRDSNPENHQTPILGANDGASGVAVLMELAPILSKKKPKYGVDLVFFDGEDLGSEDHPERWCVGSNYFSQNLGSYRASFGILLDMIGDKDLQIYKEGYSEQYAKQVNDLVWTKAGKLSISNFKPEVKTFIIDDHIALIRAGIPCIDLIDFDYPYWHTLEDTPDKCSPASLEKVGKVLLQVLYE
ncbi:MAG TPA: M28 family peptidase [Terriglobales bacterium]|nr:M28 family peptidase [Terriglobales bacterium]